MTVTGATTAAIATASYTPPFKYVSSAPGTVQVTGSVTSAVSNNPTVAAGSSDSDYAWAYLQAHMMSTPSYRYAYLLWMVLALIAIIYAVSHHLRLSGGSLGAAYAKFGMRRYVVGSKKPGRRNRALPSNNLILAVALISVVTIVLCLIGSDYIVPSDSILDFGTSFRKRATNSSTSPQYTISKSFWTLGSRFGYMAFALIPAVILFALKSPPIGFLSLRLLTQLHADKLTMLHRGVAWLVWAITTAHVALWTVQLFEDSRNGKATWFYLWTNYRFICGCVAYAALCAVMVLSLRPIRKNQYEFFYIAHVILVILLIAACAVHHPVLWYWMAAAGGIWALERGWRFARFARINSIFGRARSAPLKAGPKYDFLPTSEGYGMSELKSHPDRGGYTDKTLPRAPADSPGQWKEADGEFGRRTSLGYYDEGSLQPLGSYESRYGDPYATPAIASTYAQPRSDSAPRGPAAQPLAGERSSVGTLPNFVAPEIPVGYAQAQLLPSRTVRLTVRLPHPFKWAPGQSCLLYLPELSKLQSHPFTIVNNNNESEIVILVKARKGLTRKLFNLVRDRSIAAVNAQQGRDKRFSLASTQTGAQEGMQVAPVNIRAWLDGPFGSASRVRWNEYSTIVIICGGSGISFGAAVCDFACQMMAKNRQVGSDKIKTTRIRFCWVVREYAEIAWVAGQLYRCQQMVSSTQLEISIFVTKASQRRDDFALPKPNFAGGGRRDSLESVGSEMSESSPLEYDEPMDSPADTSIQYADVIDLTNYDDEEDINDPAEQNLSDRLQHQGKVRRARSRKAAKSQGRPQPRTSNVYPPPRRGPSTLGVDEAAQGHGPRRGPSMNNLDSAADAYAAAAEGHYDPYLQPRRSSGQSHPGLRSTSGSKQNLRAAAAAEDPFAPPPGLSAFDPRRVSYRSIADSTYGMYDPYAGMNGQRGLSPSPSIMFDDNQSIAGDSVRNLLSRASRTGSMVFLEDAGSDMGGHGVSGGSGAGTVSGADAGLWIDQADYAAMNVMSEMAKPGKPKLSALLEEEIHQAGGSMIVATCGPVTLNTVVRNLVSKHISPTRIRHGDRRGHIAIYSEDYET